MIESTWIVRLPGAGTAWVMTGGTCEERHFPRIKTYDNTKTPDGSEPNQQVKTAAIDHDKLKTIIGDAVEEAKANDPVFLKKQIAELQRQLKAVPPPAPPAAAVDVEGIEKRGWERGLAAARQAQTVLISHLRLQAEELLRQQGALLGQMFEEAKPVEPKVPYKPDIRPTHMAPKPPRPSKPLIFPSSTTAITEVGPSAQKIIDVIHSAYPVSLSFEAAARRAGISKKSSAYRSYRYEVENYAGLVREGDRFRSAPGYTNGAWMDLRNMGMDAWLSKAAAGVWQHAARHQAGRTVG